MLTYLRIKRNKLYADSIRFERWAYFMYLLCFSAPLVSMFLLIKIKELDVSLIIQKGLSFILLFPVFILILVLSYFLNKKLFESLVKIYKKTPLFIVPSILAYFVISSDKAYLLLVYTVLLTSILTLKKISKALSADNAYELEVEAHYEVLDCMKVIGMEQPIFFYDLEKVEKEFKQNEELYVTYTSVKDIKRSGLKSSSPLATSKRIYKIKKGISELITNNKKDLESMMATIELPEKKKISFVLDYSDMVKLSAQDSQTLGNYNPSKEFREIHLEINNYIELTSK